MVWHAACELEDRVDAFFGRDKDRPLDDGGDGLNLQPALEVEGRFGGRASEQGSLTEGAPLCVGTSDRCVGTEDSCVGTEDGSLEISSLISDEALKRILSGDGSLKCDGLRQGCASTGGGACVLPCYPGSAA
jgi:hypothetical protein